MYQDYKDLLSAFQSRGVKYLVVGGFAVTYHDQPRFMKDLDPFISSASANAEATYAALSDFGDRNSFFRFGCEPNGFDILPHIEGVEFDAAWERRVEIIIDPATGQKATFISAEDLIASKLASARPQDLADASAVQEALRSRSHSSDSDG